eukprot:CAMPEP_0196803390 /NCGR_PEP_ID=MMETSP1362-20130617/2779_1 /TAXON_ID=163516 /ORGANISM="Leptocylindrus danicus, Strain CCMP1856" /LENGTH=397 /DNA_ID=CAMNT_0042174939 /DNA_START=146 /DNA_END=1339 /DNA_ORIENTATION=-
MKVIHASSLLLSYSASVSGFTTLPQSYCKECAAASQLHMSGDRAHNEKMFEDMMGDDWRTVRAKLVAQEKIDSIEYKEEIRHAHRSMHHSNTAWQSGGNGNFYSGAMSFQQSMFNRPHNGWHRSREGKHFGRRRSNQPLGPMDKPKIPKSSLAACKDPFANVEEIPALVEPRVKIDSKRWAHQLPNIEPGCVLVATERLGGQFKQTVMLVVDHDPTGKMGSTGMVINRPLQGTLAEVSKDNSPEFRSHLNKGLKMIFNDARVAYGGPVMPDDYTVLHGWGEVQGSKKVAPGVFVGGSTELAYEACQSKFNPKEALFVKGHEVFAPNQLQHEINSGVWYIASVSSDFILRYANAIPKEGDDPNELWYEILMAMDGRFDQIARDYAQRPEQRQKPQKLP